MRSWMVALVPISLLLAGCGSKSSPTGPTPIPTPTPTPTGGGTTTGGSYTVSLVVFLDENSNGRLDASEGGRVPDVEVQLGSLTGRADERTGRVVLTGVPGGVLSLGVQPESLPPYYEAPAPATVRVPEDTGHDVPVPLRLHIGQNRPGYYLAFGDSITTGDGSSDQSGYRNRLLGKLERHFGEGVMIGDGAEGTMTDQGAARLPGSLASARPAYTLILYGTNDWNTASCRANFPCGTIDNLRLMIHRCRNMNSLPVLGTIIPSNPNANIAERNQWVSKMDALIRPMAQEEGVLLADFEAAFLAQSDLASLFSDHVHPNDRGYEILSNTWFDAIAHGQLETAPAPMRRSLFRKP